jgi:glycosyl transferase family 25
LAGLSYEFFFGVDKENLHMEQLIEQQIYDDKKASKLDRYGKEMITGHIACSLSHRNIYEVILRNGYDKVLIFEDDAEPLPNNLVQLPETMKELPGDWALVYLGYIKHEEVTPALKRKQALYKVLSSLGLMKWNPTMVSNLLPLAYSPHLKIAGYHDCTHAYALTASAAKALLSLQTPVAFNSDTLISYAILNGLIKPL